MKYTLIITLISFLMASCSSSPFTSINNSNIIVLCSSFDHDVYKGSPFRFFKFESKKPYKVKANGNSINVFYEPLEIPTLEKYFNSLSKESLLLELDKHNQLLILGKERYTFFDVLVIFEAYNACTGRGSELIGINFDVKNILITYKNQYGNIKVTLTKNELIWESNRMTLNELFNYAGRIQRPNDI